MAEKTGIQWADHTWSPWRGCTKVSPGCQLCYAEALSRRNPAVLGEWGPNGARVVNKDWRKPLQWDRAAAKAGVRRRVFPSLCDWLEDREELVDVRERFAAMIQATPNLDWLLLTKRPESIGLASEAFGWDVQSHGLPPNVWYGVSVENQEYADVRLPHIAGMQAAVRWVSYEPALGPVDFAPWAPALDWIVVGGESSQGGKAARPFDVAWARGVIDQCRNAGTAVFVKQLGASPVGLRLADSHGGDPDEWPADIRIQDFPSIRLEGLT